MQVEERKDYCVYMHVDKEGVPFYVGSGTIHRANSKELSARKGKATCRGKQYSIKVAELMFDYDVEIVETMLTKRQAIEMETELYYKHRETIVNKSKPGVEIDMSKDELEKFVKYDETSSTCLRWVIDRYALGETGKLNAKAGEEAGFSFYNKSRHFKVKINKKLYSVSRVVAVLHGLDVSGFVVDHVDGDVTNNKISNLRVISFSENCRNKKKLKSNTSGVTGVYLRGTSRWIASWTENGVCRSKSFNILVHGNDTAFRLACEYRDSKIKELNEQGAGYTERHGT